MSTTKISLEPLQKALASLENALKQPKNEFTRDATIQRFEYTFELTWKLLKRYLDAEEGAQEYNIKDLFRTAAKHDLIKSVDNWFTYHKARNLTSHTYHEQTAEETYAAAKLFAHDAKQLLTILEKRLTHAT